MNKTNSLQKDVNNNNSGAKARTDVSIVVYGDTVTATIDDDDMDTPKAIGVTCR